jgi:hypothetical protein
VTLTADYVFPLAGAGVAPPSAWTPDQGVDISAPGHTLLRAIGAGTIVGHGISGFGDWAPILRLDTGPLKGKYVYYGHAGPGHELPVGTKVRAGQVVGKVGISTGPHLEIGFASNPAGQPAGTQTSGAMLALLKQTHGSSTSQSGVLDTLGNVAGAVAKDFFPHKVDHSKDPLNTGTADIQQQLGQGAEQGAQAVAGAVFNDLWSAIGDNAMKVLLYVLLVGGGLALALSGVRHLAHTAQEPA